MPWKVLKRPCKQSDGTSGTYVIVKVKSGGRTEQSSCHTSKEKAQGAVRARYANEGKMRLTRRQLRRIMKEEISLLREGNINPEDWRDAQAKMDSILRDIADEERVDLSYEAINVMLSEPGWWEWTEAKVDKDAVTMADYTVMVQPKGVWSAYTAR